MPKKKPAEILKDFVSGTPGDEGKWFAAAKSVGLYAEAIDLANRSPCDPKTLVRAARDMVETVPRFAVECRHLYVSEWGFTILFTVMILVVIFGLPMYLIEDLDSGFTIIPQSIYWAIVTLTAVGCGDISPQTAPGQFLSALIMAIGFGMIAAPTGILTVEMAQTFKRKVSTRACPECSAEGHDADARHCKYCGARL
jgi:voltage-gated potassium channel Kch